MEIGKIIKEYILFIILNYNKINILKIFYNKN